MKPLKDFAEQTSQIIPIDDYSEFNKEALNQILNQEPTLDWAILVPNKTDQPQFESLKQKFGPQYFIQFGFTCPSEAINIIGEPTGSISIDIHQMPAPANIQSEYLATQKNDYLSIWQNHFGDELSNWFWKHILESSSTSDIVGFRHDGKLVGMITLYPTKNFRGEDNIQIGWIWIESNVKLEIRKSIQFQISTFLNQMKNTVFQAGVHNQNIRSQKIFFRMGFKPICAYILTQPLR